MAEEAILYICWQDPEGKGIYPVGRLLRASPSSPYEFRYLKGALEAHEAYGFQPFLSFPDFLRRWSSEQLFPFFQNLLMSEKRDDYPQYMRRLGLEPTGPPDPFAVISRDLGGGASEKLEVFGLPEEDLTTGSLTYHFLARGVRHIPGAEEAISELREGSSLEIETDPRNPMDPRAVKLLGRPDRRHLGYVPFYLTEDFARWTRDGTIPDLIAEKVNLPPATVHHRLLCRMTVRPRPGFQPFSSPRFAPVEPSDRETALPPAAAGHPGAS